ncbi:MAG: hydrogenase 4 subunit F [Legionellales bacterium]|nr:hydrogenase 4 subunit F [Legionellales bacterium]
MLLIGLLLVPLFGALWLAFVHSLFLAKYVSMGCCVMILLIAGALGWEAREQGQITLMGGWFYLDALNLLIILLTAFIALTISIFSITYFKNELKQRLSKQSLRFYHPLYQFFLFTIFLLLTTNNLGILWVAMEGATLSTVLLVALYKTPASLEAAWKYLILCGVGLAQALLGIILLYFAAEKIIDIQHALFWTELQSSSSLLSPRITAIAFVFILVGYGTKVGFVPLHNWLPDAYGESVAPVLALLSGILLNAAFYAILRCKIIVDGAVGPAFSNHLLMGFGLLNVLVASFFLLRQRDIRRLFAYSSIEHIGLISFAFGLGTPLAIFAGLLHIVVHSLSKSAAFFGVGQVIQTENSSSLDQLRGLIHDYPLLGWGLFLSSLALLGVPPFALFTSEFLILFTTIEHYPVLAFLLAVGLSISFAAILYKVQRILFTEKPTVLREKQAVSVVPMMLHLVLVLMLGFVIPMYLMGGANQITRLLIGMSA